MRVTKSDKTTYSLVLQIEADELELSDIKRQVFNELRPQVKASGFRPGKAPDHLVEKELGQQLVQNQFLDHALLVLINKSLKEKQLSILGQPSVSILKFVPYSNLSIKAELELKPIIKLPDIKSLNIKKTVDKVTDKAIEDVLHNLRLRSAVKEPVDRAAKAGDEVLVDFKGTDSKGGAVAGASGESMPVAIGSKTFIPGFEEKLVGLKAGQKKKFDLIFPKDYHAKSLQGTKVTFDTKVNEVKSVVLPELNDDFAKSISPFQTFKELRGDVARQLEEEYEKRADKAYREALMSALIGKIKLDLPPRFTNSVLEELKQEFQSNLQQRGMDEDQLYKSEDTTAAEYEKDHLVPAAKKRVKASLILGEVARQYNIEVTRDELDTYVQFLEQHYQKDEKALEQLKRPEVREDIAMQMLTDRTIDQLVKLSTPN